MTGRSWAIFSVTAILLSGPPALAQDLTAGRTPAQLFAAGCSACHKSPQGLAKGVSFSLSGFLRQHYTSKPEMADALAAYLTSAGNVRGPQPASATGRVKPSASGEQPAAQSARVRASPGATDGGKPLPEQAAASTDKRKPAAAAARQPAKPATAENVAAAGAAKRRAPNTVEPGKPVEPRHASTRGSTLPSRFTMPSIVSQERRSSVVRGTQTPAANKQNAAAAVDDKSTGVRTERAAIQSPANAKDEASAPAPAASTAAEPVVAAAVMAAKDSAPSSTPSSMPAAMAAARTKADKSDAAMDEKSE